MSWTSVALGDVCEVVSGATPKSSVDSYWGGDVAWATPADLSRLPSAYISDTPRKITQAGLKSCAATLLPPNSVLLSSRAPIGHVAINTVPMATNQGFKSLVPETSRLDAKFLYHWLVAKREYLQSIGNGATFKEVSKSVVSRVEIPLPPLDEQRQIAAILDKADSLRQKRKQAIALLDSLTQSIFLEMFGDPATNPNRYPLKSVAELAQRISDGPFGSNLKSSHYVENGVRVIRLQNIGVGAFVDNDTAFISEEHFDSLKRHECLPGDVLIGTLGDPNLRACQQPPWLGRALNKADCLQFRPNLRLLLPKYFVTLLNLKSTVSLAQNLVLGQTRGRISMGRLRGLMLPIAPLREQERFTDRLRYLEKLKKAHLLEEDGAGDLFASLQQRAFAGEL